MLKIQLVLVLSLVISLFLSFTFRNHSERNKFIIRAQIRLNNNIFEITFCHSRILSVETGPTFAPVARKELSYAQSRERRKRGEKTFLPHIRELAAPVNQCTVGTRERVRAHVQPSANGVYDPYNTPKRN